MFCLNSSKLATSTLGLSWSERIGCPGDSNPIFIPRLEGSGEGCYLVPPTLQWVPVEGLDVQCRKRRHEGLGREGLVERPGSPSHVPLGRRSSSRSPAPPASGTKAISRMVVAGGLASLAGARSRALWALGCCHDPGDLSGPEPDAAARWLVTRSRPGQSPGGG